jgi:hypothetical protein
VLSSFGLGGVNAPLLPLWLRYCPCSKVTIKGHFFRSVILIPKRRVECQNYGMDHKKPNLDFS